MLRGRSLRLFSLQESGIKDEVELNVEKTIREELDMIYSVFTY